MSAIQQKAADIARTLNRDHFVPNVVAFDPMLVLVIAQILYQLVKLYQTCGASEETAVKRAMNPGILGRWRMSNIIKSKIQGGPYQAYYHQIKRAIEQSSEELTVGEMAAFYSEAKS